MLDNMNMKIMFEEIVKPSSPTPNHLRYLPASVFDHVNSPVLMPLIFFFDPHNNISNIRTNDVLDRLRRSLPLTLSVFYPLAGRVQDINHIVCNDEGVPYVQAKVDKHLEDVVHKAEVSQLDKLLPPYGQEEGFTRLLLAIQVNVFACGGLAIGVLMNHAISDAFSFLMFVKTWASLANKGNDDSHMGHLGHPNFDIWKRFPPPQKSSSMDDSANHVTADHDPNLIIDRPKTKWFVFSKTKLEALRSLLFSNNTKERNHSLPSIAMVLSSFIWSRINVACHQTSAKKIPLKLYQAVNLRPQVSPPPVDDEHYSYYFGNMVVNAMVTPPSMAVNDADNYYNQLSYKTLWWRDILRQTKESIGRILSSDGSFVKKLLEGKEDLRFITENFVRESKGEIVVHGFSNLRSLPVYEADFGWGKPVWVTSATLKYKNLVILIPAAPSSDDIVAYINLSGDDIAKLETDEEFSSFVSMAPRAIISSKL